MNGIGYVDRTWNPVTGCAGPCSPGCANCWAVKTAHKLASNPKLSERARFKYEGFRPALWTDRLEEPRTWRRPQRVAVSFMGDLFSPTGSGLRDLLQENACRQIWNVMAMNQQHTFLILTKRPKIMQGFLNSFETLPNVWVGVTVCGQEEADAKIPVLLETPAAVRWVSLEPMLEAIDLKDNLGPSGIDWVVLGGEKAKDARPMHPGLALGVLTQCQAAGTPFWFKGWGTWVPIRYWHKTPEGKQQPLLKVGTNPKRELVVGNGREWPLVNMRRTNGKAPAVLGGQEWRQLPKGKCRKTENRKGATV